jgi:hypothetical protein
MRDLRPESTQRSYRARKSCLETAGLVLARAPSLTILAHVGAGLETVWLPGRCCVPASLHARPATPVAGEAGGKLLQYALPVAVDPGRGGGMGEGGGDTRWWWCR